MSSVKGFRSHFWLMMPINFFDFPFKAYLAKLP